MNRRVCVGLSGLALSVVLMALVFRRLDWAAFLLALRKVEIGWIFLAALATAVAVVTRSLRWQALCGTRHLHHFWSFWRAQALGCLGNMLFPARAGELIRVVALRKLSGIPAAHAVSSGVMDRVADGLGAVCLLFAVTAWLQIGFLQGQLLIWFALLFGGLAFLSGVFVIWGSKFTSLATRLAGHRSGLAEQLTNKYLQAFHAAQHLRRPGPLAIVGGLTILSYACDALAAWLTTVAFGWHLPLSCGIVVALFLVLATALPCAPGYVGVFQVACVLSLRIYHVDDSGALAYSLVLQLLVFCTVLLQGGLVGFTYGFNTLGIVSRGSFSGLNRRSTV